MSLLCIVSKMPKSQKNIIIFLLCVYTETSIYNTCAGKMTLTFSLQRKQQHLRVCICVYVCVYVCVCVCVCQWRVHGDSDWQYIQRQFDGRSTSHQRSTPPTSNCHAGQYLLSCQRPQRIDIMAFSTTMVLTHSCHLPQSNGYYLVAVSSNCLFKKFTVYYSL